MDKLGACVNFVCVLAMFAFHSSGFFHILSIFYFCSFYLMISIGFWWLLFDSICLALATQDKIPDLNHSPPSSPISVQGNIHDDKQSNSAILYGTGSFDRPSAFKKWSNVVQPTIIPEEKVIEEEKDFDQIKIDQKRERWRKKQKIKRQNQSKEQKKIDSSKNYERYKARMRKATDERAQRELERKSRNQKNYINRLKMKKAQKK